MNFSALTQVALLETGRQPIAMAAGETDLNRLLQQLDLTRPEESLLAAAALSGLHEAIGQLPARDTAPAPEPCAKEVLPRMSERAGSLLLRLLGGDFPELLPECLQLSTRAGQLPFPEALPGLLSTGRNRAEWRETVLPLLGQRGRWLATQNPEWAWAVGATAEDETIWQVGDVAARLLFLQRQRRTAPAHARELLAASWSAETPEDRASFIAVLGIGLTPADEPLLEAALDDRRKEVRRHAVNLLAQLPDSALVRRLTERARPLLTFVPAEAGSLLKLKKAKPAAVEITLPAECDKAMQRDGIDPKPVAGFGEKIGWLIQMLELVPLEVWTAEWHSPPADIIAASLQSEWAKELFEAWTRAAVRQQHAGWAETLFTIALQAKRVHQLEGLLGALPARQQERLLAPLLAADDGTTGNIQGALVNACRHAWSFEFSRSVLAWLRKITALPGGDWQLRNQFKGLATRLAVPALAEVAAPWPTAAAGWEFWSKGVDEFLALAQFRADLHAAFPMLSTSTPQPL